MTVTCQVLWENLECSRGSQWCRQLLSSLIVLLFILIGTLIISATTIAKPYVEQALTLDSFTPLTGSRYWLHVCLPHDCQLAIMCLYHDCYTVVTRL